MFLPWRDAYSMLSLRCFPPRCLLSLPFTEVSYPEISVQVSELTFTSSWYRLTSLISSSVVSIFLRSGLLEIFSFCWSHGLWFLCYYLQLIYLLIFYMFLSTSYWLRDSSRPVCLWLNFFFPLCTTNLFNSISSCGFSYYLFITAVVSFSLQRHLPLSILNWVFSLKLIAEKIEPFIFVSWGLNCIVLWVWYVFLNLSTENSMA